MDTRYKDMMRSIGGNGHDTLSDGVCGTKDKNGQFTPGTTLTGRYRISSVVGVGGFGVVYEAIDTGSKNRVVAIKTLKQGICNDEKAVKRFEREIRLCSEIKSKHVVKITDSGWADGETLYYVMEFLKGCTLEDRIARGDRFSFCDVKKIYQQILDALCEAHQKGIVHRDLKPANIWLMEVTPGSKNYEVKVLDFGIAKSLQVNDSENLTQTGAWMGSPAYMSPEQLSGKGIGPASDIFALGLIAIEMLTGRQAIEGSSAMDIAMKIYSDVPIHIDEWLQGTQMGDMIAKCVQKDSKVRCADASEMLQILNAMSDRVLRDEFEQARQKRGLQSDANPDLINGIVVSDNNNDLENEIEKASKLSMELIIAIAAASVLLLCLLGFLLLRNPSHPEQSADNDPLQSLSEDWESQDADQNAKPGEQGDSDSGNLENGDQAQDPDARYLAVHRQMEIMKAQGSLFSAYMRADKKVMDELETEAKQKDNRKQGNAQGANQRQGSHKKGKSTSAPSSSSTTKGGRAKDTSADLLEGVL